jgi:hypothetical protein
METIPLCIDSNRVVTWPRLLVDRVLRQQHALPGRPGVAPSALPPLPSASTASEISSSTEPISPHGGGGFVGRGRIFATASNPWAVRGGGGHPWGEQERQSMPVYFFNK